MKDFIKVMKALSDPNRVKIVKMLQHRVMCVCEMQAILDLAQPTVSKHLKILEEAGLVSYRKEGLWVNYFLDDGHSSPYAATLLGNMRHWLDEDPEVAAAVEKIPSTRREDICKAKAPSGRAGENGPLLASSTLPTVTAECEAGGNDDENQGPGSRL